MRAAAWRSAVPIPTGSPTFALCLRSQLFSSPCDTMETLPVEMLNDIFSFIPKAELHPLLLVNKHIYTIARPILYKIIDLPSSTKLIKCLDRQPENKKSIHKIRIGPANLPWDAKPHPIDPYHFLTLPALETLIVRHCALHIKCTTRKNTNKCQLKRLVLDGCKFDDCTLAYMLRTACSLQRFLHRDPDAQVKRWSWGAAGSEFKDHAESLTHISAHPDLLRSLFSQESLPQLSFVGMIDPTESMEPIRLPGT